MQRKEGSEEQERGFYDPETNTFYKVKNNQIYDRVLKFLAEQKKVK